MLPGCWVNTQDITSDNTDTIRRKCMSAGTRDSGQTIRCYTCGKFGHVAKACTTIDGSGWRKISLGKGLL
jgi:Zinc knuckle.